MDGGLNLFEYPENLTICHSRNIVKKMCRSKLIITSA